jgi:hypothetical protein
MQARKPIKKIFVRFFTMSRLSADGYSVTEGNSTPRNFDIPDMEVKSRELSDLNFFIPDDAIGFVFYEIIATQIEDNGQLVELTSGEINFSDRYFFQNGDNYGRIVIRDEAREEYDRHTYMRRYHHAPLPEKIILYTGEHYYKHGYSVSRVGRHHTRESSYHVCTFDFLEADVAVPIWYNFAQGHMIKAFAEKKGWPRSHQSAA